MAKAAVPSSSRQRAQAGGDSRRERELAGPAAGTGTAASQKRAGGIAAKPAKPPKSARVAQPVKPAPSSRPAAFPPAPKSVAERPPRPRVKPAGAYHHGALRETLLDAAEALLAQRGADALSLRDVARGAGVSHAAPYHHFAGLPELLAALAARSFQQLGAAMQAGVDAHPADARDQLLAIATAYVDFARRRPARFRLMFGPVLASRQQHPALDHAAAASFRVLLDAATRFDATAGPLIALTGWSLAHGLSHLSLDAAFAGLPLPGPLPDAAELIRLMSARVLATSPSR